MARTRTPARTGANAPLGKCARVQPPTPLPHLPVPELAATLSTLIPSVRPLASSPAEVASLEAQFKDFMATQGPKAQARLVERANACRRLVESWRASGEPKGDHPDGSPYPNNHFLEHWWDQYAYLAWPDSLSCFSNVMVTFFESTPHHDALLRATWLTLGIVDFGMQLLRGELEPDKGLCSSQYMRVLWTTRKPGAQSDRIVTMLPPAVPVERVTGPFADRQERLEEHVAVTCKGHWYSVALTGLSPETLYKTLQHIRNDAAARPAAVVVMAHQTGQRRDVWAAARVRLAASSETSADSLRQVEEAMFHLVLSDETPEGPAQTQLALQEARGAWLDKSTTIIVFANGACGANLEHAAADAVVPARMLVHANDFAATNDKRTLGKASDCYAGAGKTKVPKVAFAAPAGAPAAPVVRFLAWNVDDVVKADVEAARKHLEGIYADNQLSVATVPGVTMDVIKKAGMAPDSFMQMALQLAYARDQRGQTPPTYETASTRAFWHGRTECIRTQSMASKAFCDALVSGVPADCRAAKRALLEGQQYHKDYTRKASNGLGVDRHLMCLKLTMAEDFPNEALHAVFAHPLIARGSDYQLSTSQLPWSVPDRAFENKQKNARAHTEGLTAWVRLDALGWKRSGVRRANAKRCRLLLPVRAEGDCGHGDVAQIQ